jgi:hypothetical protein
MSSNLSRQVTLSTLGTLLWTLLRESDECTYPRWVNTPSGPRLALANTDAGLIYADSPPETELNFMARPCNPGNAAAYTVAVGQKPCGTRGFSDN